MIGWVEGPGEDVDPPAWRPGRGSRLQRQLIGSAAEQGGIEPAEDGREIDGGIRHDPVDLTIGTGDVSVQTGRYAVSNLSHRTTLTSKAPHRTGGGSPPDQTGDPRALDAGGIGSGRRASPAR